MANICLWDLEIAGDELALQAILRRSVGVDFLVEKHYEWDGDRQSPAAAVLVPRQIIQFSFAQHIRPGGWGVHVDRDIDFGRVASLCRQAWGVPVEAAECVVEMSGRRLAIRADSKNQGPREFVRKLSVYHPSLLFSLKQEEGGVGLIEQELFQGGKSAGLYKGKFEKDKGGDHHAVFPRTAERQLAKHASQARNGVDVARQLDTGDIAVFGDDPDAFVRDIGCGWSAASLAAWTGRADLLREMVDSGRRLDGADVLDAALCALSGEVDHKSGCTKGLQAAFEDDDMIATVEQAIAAHDAFPGCASEDLAFKCLVVASDKQFDAGLSEALLRIGLTSLRKQLPRAKADWLATFIMLGSNTPAAEAITMLEKHDVDLTGRVQGIPAILGASLFPHWAMPNGHRMAEVAKHLAERGIVESLRHESGYGIVEIALSQGNLPALTVLLEAGIAVHEPRLDTKIAFTNDIEALVNVHDDREAIRAILAESRMRTAPPAAGLGKTGSRKGL